MEEEDSALLRSKRHKDMIKAASRGDHAKLVHLIDTYRLNLNYTNVCNETALHQAVLCGSMECTEELIKRGCKITVSTCFGMNVIHNASRSGNEKLLAYIIEKIRESASFLSPLSDLLQGKSYDDRTPLHIASGYGNLSCLKVLLENGANLNSKTEGGLTPLAFASFRGQNETVAVLLEAGANPNAKTFQGETPLHLACRRSNYEEITPLLEALINRGGSLKCRKCRKKNPCSSKICMPSLEFVLEKRNAMKPVASGNSLFSIFRRN